MKRVIKTVSLILVLALFALMAMASGSSNSANNVKEPSSVSGNTEKNETNTAPTDSGSKTNTKNETLEEAVIFDKDGIKVTVKGLEKSGLLGPSVKMLVENGSSKNITVQARKLSVNGYMVEDLMSIDVASGKKANDSMTIANSSLKQSGITTIADIEFCLHIFDSDSWDTMYDSEPISLKTSAYDGYVYSFDNSGFPVYNDKGIEVVVKGLSEDASILGPSILVYISNTSQKDITVQTRDVSVNGFMVDTIFSCDVAKGKHAVDKITFLNSDFEKNDIKKIEEVELSIHIFDEKSWDTIVDTKPITIEFK